MAYLGLTEEGGGWGLPRGLGCLTSSGQVEGRGLSLKMFEIKFTLEKSVWKLLIKYYLLMFFEYYTQTG